MYCLPVQKLPTPCRGSQTSVLLLDHAKALPSLKHQYQMFEPFWRFVCQTLGRVALNFSFSARHDVCPVQ